MDMFDMLFIALFAGYALRGYIKDLLKIAKNFIYCSMFK